MKKLFALALAALMLCGLLAGCGASADPGKSEAVDFGDTLTVVMNSTGSNFDPLTSYDSDWQVCYQIYDTLFRIDDDGNPAPHVAESWEESTDGTKLTIHLRKDIKFHDGTPLNAEAVIFAFTTSHDVELNAWLNDLIPEWKAIDEYTVELTKGQPYTPIYYSLMARPHLVSPTAYQADPVAFAQNPVGSGAYKFVSKGSDDVVHLVANEDYFLGAPYFKNLVMRPPMESATSVIALQNGEIDLVVNLTPNQVSVAKGIPEITVSQKTGWSQTMVIMAGEPFTNNRALRQAVAHAIDPQKAAILNEQPDAAVATDLFSAKELGVYAGLVPPLGYDRARSCIACRSQLHQGHRDPHPRHPAACRAGSVRAGRFAGRRHHRRNPAGGRKHLQQLLHQRRIRPELLGIRQRPVLRGRPADLFHQHELLRTLYGSQPGI